MRKVRAEVFNPASINSALFDAPEKKTPAVTKREIRRLLKRLRRSKGATTASITLAEKIDACTRHERCKSPACPVCARVAQRQYAKLLDDFLRTRKPRGSIYVVTIVPSDGASQPGALTVGTDKLAMRRIKHAMRKAGIRWFVGASDWSRNEHRDAIFPPRWALHVHGFTTSSDSKELRRRLKKRFPATTEIDRPIKVKEWDGNQAAGRYCLKSTFTRRISIESERFDRHAGKTRPCRNTDKQPLRSSEVRELLPHVDELGIGGRIVLLGARIRNDMKYGASIELLNSKRRRRGRN